MKRKLVLLLTAMALMLPQTMKAQDDGSFFVDFHEKADNPSFTVDIKPENVFNAILDDYPGGDNYMPWKGSWMELERKVTDSFGNVHVTFCQMYEPDELSEYQIVLHFRPDGSLYYRNGTLVLQEKETAQNAKARIPASRISAERAAVIATGSPLSKTVKAIANHKGKPRDAYKVKDMATMKYVYVDAYSGEILYTISLIHSFAPWGDVKGNAVTLPANTSYEGVQELTVMQTGNGYILRDPLRNIVTIDATDKLADRDTTNLPKNYDEQFILLMDSCDDVSFADKADLLNQKYATSIRSCTIWLDPKMEKEPDSLHFEVRYYDMDLKYVKDVSCMDVSNPAWTDDKGRKKCTITFKDRPSIDLIGFQNVTILKMNGETYYAVNAICAGERQAFQMIKDDVDTDVECGFDVEVDARQLVIDVHWAIQKIYDMYEEYYGIKGCDGEGSQIVNIVNHGNNIPIAFNFPGNAFANNCDITDSHGEKTYIMGYGAGIPGTHKPLTCFDITAHEFSHLVTTGCCNDLQYMNESGALKEALADCMAMVAEDYLYGEASWTISEKTTLDRDYMRSLSNPWYSSSKDGKLSNWAQPKYYHGKYWFDFSVEHDWVIGNDNGGVHFNSGVFNYLFYLLCEGGMGATNEKGETSDIIPVGMDRMKYIIFHDMRYYNTYLCSYAEIADNLLIAIEDLFGDDKEAVSDIQRKFLTAYGHVGMKSAIFPTGITRHELDTTPASDSRTYNLYGIPVGDNYKGVVIKDGKRIMKK